MRKFNRWVIELTKDERGNISVKPVIAIIGAIFLCVTMAFNVFINKNIEPSDTLIDAVVIITAIGMGADSLDKFSFRSKTVSKSTAPQELNNE
jgi:hypothetical protein